MAAGVDTLDKVRSLYGKGAETNVQDVRSLCYYVEQDRAYLSVSSFEHENRIRNIALTTLADIAPGCQGDKIAGKHLTAVGAISLRDSMAKVRGLLGTPITRGTMQMANHELTYEDYSVAGGQLTCQYEEDKLVLIAVEASSAQHSGGERKKSSLRRVPEQTKAKLDSQNGADAMRIFANSKMHKSRWVYSDCESFHGAAHTDIFDSVIQRAGREAQSFICSLFIPLFRQHGLWNLVKKGSKNPEHPHAGCSPSKTGDRERAPVFRAQESRKRRRVSPGQR